MNEKLDIKDSICLPDDFRKWIDACDKLDEGVQVSDPEMQKHIDTYEKHLEREGTRQGHKSVKELDQQGAKYIQPDLPQNTGNVITQLKQLAESVMNDPQVRVIPKVQEMVNLINRLR